MRQKAMCNDGFLTSSTSRAQQGAGGSQSSGRGWGGWEVGSPYGLGFCTGCEIPPELSRTWHLDSG